MLAIGCDHAGFTLKNEILSYLEKKNIPYRDFGAYSDDSCHFPFYASLVASAVQKNECERGILICGTGIGMSIAANKFKGIRAALCMDEYQARMAKRHNNANILVLAGRITPKDTAFEIIDIWLNENYLEGKYETRNGLIRRIEEGGSMSGTNYMDMAFVFDHPLIQHKISIMRDKNTNTKEFRELVKEVSTLMGYEVTRELPLEEIEVETPIAKTTVKVLSGKNVGFVPILRAGLGMVDGLLTLIPTAKIGHIGLYRDHETLQPVEYYCKLPEDAHDRMIILLDPMLATGGSASAAIGFLKQRGVKNIKLMSIIAAPQGIQKVHKDHPDVNIYCACVDQTLNDNAYIVPGLGDAGDRLFGTK
ncbi:MAG: uracil phosphoribosyltransferase [Clostridia bacterium]|jgi:uracil phosphoribosyltransferase|nr:uracil phosphoribosyltransferase [Clostridia bacterium]NLV33737.1 uracil phosphoribosyltransferase [Clostridiaceae bacterium]OQB53615.1 MAG: Uracil phosphoribosyltransferase [Firmicutes bacterium ADurb.Bin146]MDD4501776.1 uracil phosphoribosyltransferase [Clostridia bacterium]HQM95775.1 uracil phosphoribosyltransferase [Clostridia bacterium]